MRQELIAARKLIEHPEHWIKYEYATTKDDVVCDLHWEKAYKFCLAAAIIREANLQGNSNEEIVEIFNHLEINNYKNLLKFNDNSTHQEILDFLDREIERAS